jgi:hypothetical protein
MDEHNGDLKILAKKYADQVHILESQLAEAKRRLAVVTEAVDLLTKEGIFEQAGLFPITTPISDKFKDMSMAEAIKVVLESAPLNKASAGTVLLELQRNGFKSASKNFKRDVYTRLFRLEQKKRLLSKKEKGIKIYYLPAKEVIASEEKPL